MNNTKRITEVGLLTAIIVVLQVLAASIKIGIFNISLVLIPIVVGGALFGRKTGAWLGFVFGVVVLFTGSQLFLAVSVVGTIVVVLAKGILAGYTAGLVCDLLKKKNSILSVVLSALVCPVVNTGVFLIGCKLFFMDLITQWATQAGYANVGLFMIIGLVGANFLVEMGINIVLSPAIVQIIKIIKR